MFRKEDKQSLSWHSSLLCATCFSVWILRFLHSGRRGKLLFLLGFEGEKTHQIIEISSPVCKSHYTREKSICVLILANNLHTSDVLRTKQTTHDSKTFHGLSEPALQQLVHGKQDTEHHCLSWCFCTAAHERLTYPLHIKAQKNRGPTTL